MSRSGRWSEEQTMLSGKNDCMGWGRTGSEAVCEVFVFQNSNSWTLGFCGWWIKDELRFYLSVFLIRFAALARLSLGKFCVLFRWQISESFWHQGKPCSVSWDIGWGGGKWQPWKCLEAEANRCQMTFHSTYKLVLNSNSCKSSNAVAWIAPKLDGVLY